MAKRVEVLESSHFSTGNGGATFEIERISYDGSHATYQLIHEISHYGLTQESRVMVNDLGMMDEMIAMMQRARAEMARNAQQPAYGSRVSRRVIDGVPVHHAPQSIIKGDDSP
ncbi:MAG: hypothetical protein EOP83_26760 [Verrucomicrobiaceae bacterium]|nr:MAG: hypothetical protein EOP83_26760 [Verrucomicrobiaceae bacterium]